MNDDYCDGCLAGYPISRKDGIHRLSDGAAFMLCRRHKREGLSYIKTNVCVHSGPIISCDKCKE